MELNKALKRFFINEPFYGTLMLNLNKEIVGPEHDVKTAAIGPKGLGFTLYVNEEFWSGLSDKEQIALLKHESMHVAFMHLSGNFYVPDSDFELMNIAQDCEINQYIKDLPSGGVTIDKLNEKLGCKLKRNAGSWYYFNELKSFRDENSKKINEIIKGFINGGESTDHSLWPKNTSDAEKILLENHLKSIIKNTAEACKTAGTIPGELKNILDSIFLKEEIYNWRSHFRRMLGNSIRTYIDSTRYRPSKRFPDSPGLKTKSKPSVIVAVDTSGSIRNEDLNDFFSEIYYLYKSGLQVTVLEFDTKIQDRWEYKGNLKNIPIKGRGGTCAKEVIDFYKKHKDYSACVIFTDGYLNIDLPSCQQLIWVITKGGKKDNYPGKTIYIP